MSLLVSSQNFQETPHTTVYIRARPLILERRHLHQSTNLPARLGGHPGRIHRTTWLFGQSPHRQSMLTFEGYGVRTEVSALAVPLVMDRETRRGSPERTLKLVPQQVTHSGRELTVAFTRQPPRQFLVTQ